MRPAGPLIAHRGASLLEPENTLAALDRAADLGCAWVEIDAQVTRDGGVVLMHDHTVDRTTEGSGPVAMLTAAEVLRLRTRAPHSQALTDHRPPTLDSALDLCRDRGLGMVLEIKATWGVDAEDARRVAMAVPATAPRDLIVTSFSVPALQAFRQARPDIPIGLACLRPPTDPGKMVDQLGLSAVHCNTLCTLPGDLPRLRDAGLEVAIATINDQDTARRFLEAGFHGVMTDDPTLLGSGDEEAAVAPPAQAAAS